MTKFSHVYFRRTTFCITSARNVWYSDIHRSPLRAPVPSLVGRSSAVSYVTLPPLTGVAKQGENLALRYLVNAISDNRRLCLIFHIFSTNSPAQKHAFIKEEFAPSNVKSNISPGISSEILSGYLEKYSKNFYINFSKDFFQKFFHKSFLGWF